MRFVIFAHSLVSDWNHGNAHFLRGVVRNLIRRGCDVRVFEPADGWSRANLLADAGPGAIRAYETAFPELRSETYEAPGPDLDTTLDGTDVVIVHEWTDPGLVRRIAAHRAAGGRYRLLFHDTHHRAASAAADIGALALDGFDGVLAFGDTVRDLYVRRGWSRRAWTWHEAADVELFHPHPEIARERDLVWIGNWGDGERTAELASFLLGPIRDLGLSGTIHGVRYPDEALAAVRASGADFQGWIANHRVPEVFARHRVTVHVPRRPYVEALPGIPTIRMFEALACGIPLISAPWRDSEGLFRPGVDYLTASTGADMTRRLRDVLNDTDLRASLAAHGLETIRARHTCTHRVDQLLAICAELGADTPKEDRAIA